MHKWATLNAVFPFTDEIYVFFSNACDTVPIACKGKHMKYIIFFIDICNSLPDNLSTGQSKMHSHGEHLS